MKKKSRWWLKLLIALAVLGAGYFVATEYFIPKPMASLASQYDATTVVKRDFEVRIQGTGNIESASSVDIIAHRGGEIRGLTVETGDIVRKDVLMFELYDESLQDQIDQQEADIKQQGINISRTRDTLDDFKIIAPASGRIKLLEAQEGEEASPIVSAHGALCVISPDGKMEVTVPFDNATRAGTVARNQKIYARIDGMSYEGEIKEISTGSLTIELPSDNFDIGAKAEVYQDAVFFDKFGEGQLQIVNPVSVTGSGRITKVHITEGEIVSRGDVLFSLDDSDVRKSIDASGVMRDLAEETMQKNIAKLEDNKVFITQEGVLQTLNIKNGQMITQGMNVGTVVDNKNLEVIIEVDELDIPMVKLGQTAEVRVDALPSEVFEGTVTKISELGQIVNTVTTYDVTISLKAQSGIKIGMTASAEIIADSRDDVISIPREALIADGGENYVRVLPGGEADYSLIVDMSEPNAALPVFEQRLVETGVKNESSIEIISGLSEGEMVLSEKAEASNMFAMMMGGPQGGPPPQGGEGGAPPQ